MIVVHNVIISVDQKNIVSDLSLSIAPGTIHAIMGKNGSGKSSLAYTLVGYPAYEVIQGTILFEGQDLLTLSMQQRSRLGIFLAHQQPPTIPGVTIFQFLQELYYGACQLPVARTDFQNYVQGLLQDLKIDFSILYRGLHENFSGGEKKKIEILQMLLLQPKFIILDEIDSGLDVDALRLLGRVIFTYLEKNPTASCCVITHYRRILEFIKPDFVHIMHQGKIVASGDVMLSHEVESDGYDCYE
jgi:Fe-S cluster assembly ATP-binding protein